MDDLSDEDRASALHELREVLSNQETKYTAGTHEILFSCADLIESRSADVRQNAALVIASLVLFENVRWFLLAVSSRSCDRWRACVSYHRCSLALSVHPGKRRRSEQRHDAPSGDQHAE